MDQLIDVLASQGRYGDTMLAHVTPQEAAQAPTRNPTTGLPEFFLGNLLGGIGSIFGAVTGASAQNKANKVAASNQAFQNQLAQQMLDAQLGKTVDARGNVVEWDPETKTWTTTPSPMTAALIGAGDAEQYRQLTDDAALRRSGLQTNASLRAEAAPVAQQFLGDLGAGPQYDRATLAGLLGERASRGVADAYENTTQDLSRQMLRSGTGAGSVFADLGRQRAKDTSNALLDAELQSYGLYDQLEGNRLSRAATGFNTAGGFATNLDNIPFNPTTLADTLTNQQGSQRTASIGAGQVAGQTTNAAAAPLMSASRYTSPVPSLLAGLGGLYNDVWGTERDRTATSGSGVQTR